jgi:hypothetical protein
MTADSLGAAADPVKRPMVPVVRRPLAGRSNGCPAQSPRSPRNLRTRHNDHQRNVTARRWPGSTGRRRLPTASTHERNVVTAEISRDGHGFGHSVLSARILPGRRACPERPDGPDASSRESRDPAAPLGERLRGSPARARTQGRSSMPVIDEQQWPRLAATLRREVAVYAPEWTDTNESDPGIALLQLFAFLTEDLNYRSERLGDRGVAAAQRLADAAHRLAIPPDATEHALRRPNFYEGQLLTADDLSDEQSYFRARLGRRNRALHGAGGRHRPRGLDRPFGRRGRRPAPCRARPRVRRPGRGDRHRRPPDADVAGWRLEPVRRRPLRRDRRRPAPGCRRGPGRSRAPVEDRRDVRPRARADARCRRPRACPGARRPGPLAAGQAVQASSRQALAGVRASVAVPEAPRSFDR